MTELNHKPPRTYITYQIFYHTALRRKSKDWLVQNHENVFEWDDKSSVVSVSSLTHPFKNILFLVMDFIFDRCLTNQIYFKMRTIQGLFLPDFGSNWLRSFYEEDF